MSFLGNEISCDLWERWRKMSFTWDSRWFRHVLRSLLCKNQVSVARVVYQPWYDRKSKAEEYSDRREKRAPTSTFSWWMFSKSSLSRNCLVRSSTRSLSPNNQTGSSWVKHTGVLEILTFVLNLTIANGFLEGVHLQLMQLFEGTRLVLTKMFREDKEVARCSPTFSSNCLNCSSTARNSLFFFLSASSNVCSLAKSKERSVIDPPTDRVLFIFTVLPVWWSKHSSLESPVQAFQSIVRDFSSELLHCSSEWVDVRSWTWKRSVRSSALGLQWRHTSVPERDSMVPEYHSKRPWIDEEIVLSPSPLTQSRNSSVVGHYARLPRWLSWWPFSPTIHSFRHVSEVHSCVTRSERRKKPHAEKLRLLEISPGEKFFSPFEESPRCGVCGLEEKDHCSWWRKEKPTNEWTVVRPAIN